MRKSRNAGASRAGKIGIREGTVRLASDIRINDHIENKGKPCRVLDVSTSETGLCYFRTINILTGFIMMKVIHSSEEIFIPDVNREIYQLIGISSKDDSVTLLHYGCDYTRDDIKLPQDEFLRSMIVDGIEDGKRVLVGVVSALGKDAIYAVEVDQTGSAIGLTGLVFSFKRLSEDALNQSKTKDGYVVANQSNTKNTDVVVNQSKTKDSDVVVNQSKMQNTDVAKKACLKKEATKALLSKKGDRSANLSTAKYGYKNVQLSYKDVVLGYNPTGEDIY